MRNGRGLMLKASIEMLSDYSILHPESSDSAREIGYRMGFELGFPTHSETIESVVEKLSAYWAANGLGGLGWADKGSGMLRAKHLRGLTNVKPSRGRTHCPHMEGLLEGILAESMGRRVRVEEVSCGDAESGCIFKVHLAV